jgi:glycosyltransferase involved in cell wall biosynthesis
LPNNFLLYVGSIIERKNLLSLCKAIKLLENKLDIPLLVIGHGGSYKQQVHHYIAENNLRDRIVFLSDDPKLQSLESFRSALDFPAIYQQAVCLIYPSIFEGFGIPVLEALSSGLPVITSNLSCLPEAGGDAAYYVDPFSINELSKAILEVATNNLLRKNMKEKGLRHAEKFTQKKCADSVMRTYLSF